GVHRALLGQRGGNVLAADVVERRAAQPAQRQPADAAQQADGPRGPLLELKPGTIALAPRRKGPWRAPVAGLDGNELDALLTDYFPAAAPLYKSHPGSYEIVFQHKLWYAVYAEAQAIETSDAQVAAIGSMGNTPLIVIRHGKPMSMFSSLPPQEAEEMEQKWQTFQEEIARQSSFGRIIVAEASGHGIQVEQPAIIVKAVQQLLENP
ncbi:MAG: hypothetical protein HGA71_20850, partial [Azonexaceae bacterium]|nr:hypothetical protein [Azonexaceae bacterium]